MKEQQSREMRTDETKRKRRSGGGGRNKKGGMKSVKESDKDTR